LLVLLNQHGQVLAEEAVLVVAGTLAVADVSGALLVVALARRQLSMVAASEERRLSGDHTLAVERSADQALQLDSTMAEAA
jgi:hypothetical protein